MKQKTDRIDEAREFLPLDPSKSQEELLQTLRMNALMAHQRSVGRGDELIQILQRAIGQMEKTHNRIQSMSMILFAAGMLMIGVGIYQILFAEAGQEIWAVLMGGVGGVAAVVATFYTTPVDKMSESISDLVKLEAAFLGYIRVIGEVDSAFQMQYLDILAGSENVSLDQVINDTTSQMKDMMTHTLDLIDKYVVGSGHFLQELEKQNKELQERMDKFETAQAAAGAGSS